MLPIILRQSGRELAQHIVQDAAVHIIFDLVRGVDAAQRIEAEGHFYEIFIDGGFANNSNQANIGMEQRNYETNINIETLGYLIGEGENQEKPKIVKRENAVDIKLGRERTIVGDIPENIKDGFYRE